MAVPRFQIKNTGSDRPTPVYLFYQYTQGRPLKFYFGRSVLPALWDPQRRRAKPRHPHAAVFNRLLQRIEDAAMRIVDEYALQGLRPTHDQLREGLNQEIGHQRSDRSVINFIEKLIAVRSVDTRYKRGSIQVYENCLQHVRRYQENVLFDDIDMDFFHGFTDHLYAQETSGGLHFSRNHVNKILTTLKMILTEAREQDLHNNIRYQSRKFSVPKVETTKIYLTMTELMKMWQAKMPSDGLERARDLFMICAFTGVRHSDVSKIGRANFHTREGIKYFSFLMQKGGAPVAIPAHPVVQSVLEKYDWILPTISNQKLNVHLKDIAKISGIDTHVTVTTWPGGQRKDEVLPKWKLVSSHTGRRSLACNLYKAGIPRETIMRVTGHKSYASFIKYLRLGHEDHLEVVSAHPFFQQFMVAVG